MWTLERPGARWPSGLERWLGLVTWQFPAGFEPHCGKNSSLRNFANSVYPAFPTSFGWDTKSRRSLLSGVYARGSNISHQSALEYVTFVDSTFHSKLSQSVYNMQLKTLPCPEKEEDNIPCIIHSIMNKDSSIYKFKVKWLTSYLGFDCLSVSQ